MSISLWWKNLMCTPVCILGSSGTCFLQSHLLQISGFCWIFISFISDFLWKVHFLSFIYSTNIKTLFSKFSKAQFKQGSFRRRLRVTDFYCWFDECLHWVIAQLIRLILDIHFLKSSLAILLLRTSPFVTFFLECYFPPSPFISALLRDEISLSHACPWKLKILPIFYAEQFNAVFMYRCLKTSHILRPIFPQLKWLFNFFHFSNQKTFFS